MYNIKKVPELAQWPYNCPWECPQFGAAFVQNHRRRDFISNCVGITMPRNLGNFLAEFWFFSLTPGLFGSAISFRASHCYSDASVWIILLGLMLIYKNPQIPSWFCIYFLFNLIYELFDRICSYYCDYCDTYLTHDSVSSWFPLV